MSNLKLYRFRQNNTYGTWDFNDNLTKAVYIQAESAEQANERAEDIGIYFDGCDKGIDCPCCGDRWYEVGEYEAIENKTELIEHLVSDAKLLWDTNVIAIIHTLDGGRFTLTPEGTKSNKPLMVEDQDNVVVVANYLLSE